MNDMNKKTTAYAVLDALIGCCLWTVCADYTVSLTADETLLRARLIDRRMKTGVEKEPAIRFVDFSDMPNVRLCLHKTKQADLSLRIDEEGDYHIDPASAI